MVTEFNYPGNRPIQMLNLAGFLARSAVNGPGIRAVVWVQGCPFRCKGCFNEKFQPFSPATLIPADKLARIILAVPGIDGVTFSGGEPFTQADPLAVVGKILHREGLSVVTYSGYTAEQLVESDDPAWEALLAVTDLLIAGPFVDSLAAPDPLKGSTNQQVVAISRKIPVRHSTDIRNSSFSLAEFTISSDGTITTTGFPEQVLVNRIALRCGGA